MTAGRVPTRFQDGAVGARTVFAVVVGGSIPSPGAICARLSTIVARKSETRSEAMKARWQDGESRKRMLNRPQIQAKLDAKAEALANGIVECARCHLPKSPDEFPQGRTNRKGSPRYAYCKTCHSENQRVLRLKNKFNLTPEDYDTMMQFQDGLCYICKQPPKKVRLAVDHCHKTGLIRGLLCAFCNRAIAVFRDNEERLQRAVEYLKAPPATQALGEERIGLRGRTSNKAVTRKRLNKDLFQRPKQQVSAVQQEVP